MADFENCLKSGIFGIFSSGFFHRTTLLFLKNGFTRFFDIFIF